MPGTSRSGGDRVANGEDTFPRDGLPSRPRDFTKAENEYWNTLLEQIPVEILRRVDAHQLANLCESLAGRDAYYAALRADRMNKEVFNMWLKCCQQIQKASPVFGLGPLDRRRMKLAKAPDADNAEEWSDD